MADVSSQPVPSIGQPGKRRSPARMIGTILAGVLLLAFIVIGTMLFRMSYVPNDLDTSNSLASEQGVYQVSYAPEVSSIAVNQIHSWRLHVATADGGPVEDARIEVDGDMPQHGHGLPTRPKVTRYLGGGDYLVEGLKFHMPGWWIVQFKITTGDQTDQVTFNLMLE